MQQLMESTGETANLGVAEDDCVVFVSQVETHQAIRAFFRPGTRSPFHASGIGKAILAHLGAARVEAIIRKTGLQSFTDKTLSRAPSSTADLDEIRARGWSVDDEERYPGMRCVAAAIFNEFGEPVGGVSISGPTVRVTPQRLAAIGPEVREAAAAITRMIGGVAPSPGDGKIRQARDRGSRWGVSFYAPSAGAGRPFRRAARGAGDHDGGLPVRFAMRRARRFRRLRDGHGSGDHCLRPPR